jgi:hypothetical protein
MTHSIAHLLDPQARQFYPDGMATWRDAKAPNFDAGRLRGCSYCGSMHPADLAEAIRAGATVSWADFKYGWPHKLYVSGVPNPHAGLPEVTMYVSTPTHDQIASGAVIEVPTGRFSETTGQPTTQWVGKPTPAPERTHGKFYTLHLQDATPTDREVIEKAMNLTFTFSDSKVAWAPIKEEI